MSTTFGEVGLDSSEISQSPAAQPAREMAKEVSSELLDLSKRLHGFGKLIDTLETYLERALRERLKYRD